MTAPGAHDLEAILAHLDISRRPGTYVYLDRALHAIPPPDAVAMIDEGDRRSFVVPAGDDDPDEHGFRAAWLTVTVATSLDAVGLTAVLATALADAGIAANVLAGARHDHLLVPVERAAEAMRTLRALRTA